MSSEYHEAFHAPLITEAKKRNGGKATVVDVGCGTGKTIEFLNRDPDLTIIGIDRSLDALRQSTSRGMRNVLLVNADVKNSPIPDASADVGIAVGVMTFEPEAMMHMLRRTLKPNGECAVSFRLFSAISEGSHTSFRAHHSRFSDRTLSANGQTFSMKMLDHSSSSNDRSRVAGNQYYFQSIEDIERFVRTMGFDVVRHEPFAYTSQRSPREQIEVFRLRKTKE